MIEIIERLIGKGYDLRLYESNVKVACSVGANRDFILNRIPYIPRLMVDTIDLALDHAETVVAGNDDRDFRNLPERLRKDQALVEFVHIKNRRNGNGHSDGVCW